MNKKVLIIDDEDDLRFLLRRAFVARNYAVVEAGNLKQGYEHFSREDPDVIIMDINLPDGNGIQFAKKFRNNKTILIFVSADHDKLTEGYKAAGANGFFKKPFAVNQLVDLINNQVQINSSPNSN
ncbi:MAG: response regulator [Bacteroidia bacterium]|nr:response regulator [Bacteroidia bacterium]